MGKYSAKGGEDFKPVPAGAHVAVCTMVADIGIQPSGVYEPKRKIVFRFELPNERVIYKDKDGNDKNAAAIVYDSLTASMNKKANMRAMLEGWRGKAFTDEEAEDFDTKNVLGKSCLISVIHKVSGEKTYANIQAVMPIPKGMPIPEKAENPLVYFHIDDDDGSYDKLPQWVQKKVDEAIAPDKAASSREKADEQMASEHAGRAVDFDDDIPF
jgi:hypothetical protein